MEETFTRKNDLGVTIEYTVVGEFQDSGKKYCIYTDFVPENNKVGIRLFVDLNDNGNLVRLSEEEEKRIIMRFNKELINNK